MSEVIIDLVNRDDDLLPDRIEVLTVSDLRRANQAQKFFRDEFSEGRLPRLLPKCTTPGLRM